MYALVVGLMYWRAPAIRQIRGTIIIFGDGAGAAVLAASEEPGIVSTYLHADGSYGVLLTLPNADRVNPENSIHLTMAGNEVFKVAVTELAHIVDETLAANNLTVLNWTGWFRIRLTCVLSVQRRKNTVCLWTMSW
ncbi:hypothetical protein ACLK1S_06755 [Escherichia coli]